MGSIYVIKYRILVEKSEHPIFSKIRVRGFPERDICSLPGMDSGLGSRRKCCWRAAVAAAAVGVIGGLDLSSVSYSRR